MFLEAFPATTFFLSFFSFNTLVNLSRPKQTRKKESKAKEGSTLRGMTPGHGDCCGLEKQDGLPRDLGN